MVKKIGLVGLGEVALAHLDAYSKSTKIKAVAGADFNESRCNEMCARYGMRAYNSAEDMIGSENLDILVILTPAAFHLPVAKLGAQAGIAILCEKPLAITVEDAQSLVTVCETHKVPLFYGSSYRFLHPVMAAKRLIGEGAIGKPLIIREQIVGGAGEGQQHVYGPAHYPKGFPGGAGMGLVDHGIHLLDVMGWMMDAKPLHLFGRGNISGTPLKTEYAIIEYDNGATGHILYNDATWPTVLPQHGAFNGGAGFVNAQYVEAGQWDPDPGVIHVHGTLGALRVQHYTNNLYLSDSHGTREIALPNEGAPAQFRLQIEAFADDIDQGNVPRTSGQDGLAALKLLHAIYRDDMATSALAVD